MSFFHIIILKKGYDKSRICMFVGIKRIEYKQVDKTKFILSI